MNTIVNAGYLSGLMQKSLLCAFVALAVAGITTSCRDSRVTGLEQRITKLEQSTTQLESELRKSAEGESKRRLVLQACVAEANATYRKNIVNNGIKQSNGSYSVAVSVISEMRRQQQDAIEQCKLLYSE